MMIIVKKAKLAIKEIIFLLTKSNIIVSILETVNHSNKDLDLTLIIKGVLNRYNNYILLNKFNNP
jgi:hypothetical protein